MKIAEYKQIGTKQEERIIHHEAEYDEEGHEIKPAYDETIIVDVPVMGTVYREETEEEKAQREYDEEHKYDNISYADLVTQFIREKYSLDDELALSRQRETKVDEFDEYFSYCESCKQKAKEIKVN